MVYQKLFNNVMNSKSPYRVDGYKQINPFEVYKENWNRIQDKMDKEYQKKLR